MTKFLPPFEKLAYFEQALFLYKKYSKYLNDDFANNGDSSYEYFIKLVCRSAFWVIVEGDIVSGFVYLDNFIGDKNRLHSAELTTCFDKRFWGSYTKDCAKTFLEYCFEYLGLRKIKALIYPENFRVKTLLKTVGFKKEGLLESETIRNGKPQDVEVYGLVLN